MTLANDRPRTQRPQHRGVTDYSMQNVHFTEQTKLVLARAIKEAQRLRHGYLAPEHILLGILSLPESFGARLIGRLGGDLAPIRADVEGRSGLGTSEVSKGGPPFTSAAKAVIERTLTEAMDIGSAHIGTEHLLLGLFSSGAENIASDALEHHGLSVQAVRDLMGRNRAINEDGGPVVLQD